MPGNSDVALVLRAPLPLVARLAALLVAGVGVPGLDPRALAADPPCNVVAGDADAVPAFRRGFLFAPYAGVQFGVAGPAWMSYAFRSGALLGGHLSRDFSLAAEPAVATWGFLGCDSSHSTCVEPHHAVQLDAAAVLLRHVSRSRFELVFGPKLGWSVVLRNNYAERTYLFVNGPQIGAKLGLFESGASWIALGVVVDLAYTRSYKSSSRCFGAGDADCNDTKNTAFGALSAAFLF
jgi:hypothetical protein